MTEATDATTVEPSSAAFMSPMISSSANITAATGVLNAAASAPAAPTGTSRLTRVPATGAATVRWPTRGRRQSEPMALPGPSSGRTRCTARRSGICRAARAHGMMPPCRWNAASVCGTPLPRTSGKIACQQHAGDHADDGGTRNNRSRRRTRPKNSRVVRSIASVNKHRRQARQDADDDRQRQEQLVFAEPELLGRERWWHGYRSDSWRRPISTSARSSVDAPAQLLADCCSIR